MFATYDVGPTGRRDALVGLYTDRREALAHRLRLARERRALGSVCAFPLVEPCVRRLTGQREADAIKLAAVAPLIVTSWTGSRFQPARATERASC